MPDGKLPISGTKPLWNFIKQFADLYGFINLTFSFAKRADEVAKIASKALRKIDENDEGEYEDGEGIGAVAAWKKYRPQVLESLVIRNVDNFLAYLSELLVAVYRNDPRMLKSSEKVVVEDILEYENIDDLISWLIDKKITELSYAGLDTIRDEINKKHGFDLFPDQMKYKEISLYIGYRNLLVHNRGVVNRRFLRTYRSSSYVLGDKIKLVGTEVIEWSDVLRGVVEDIDKRATEKYSLKIELFQKYEQQV